MNSKSVNMKVYAVKVIRLLELLLELTGSLDQYLIRTIYQQVQAVPFFFL